MNPNVTKLESLKKMQSFALPRWKDLPEIDLYLDQILSLIGHWLGDYLSFDGKRIMTKTMINNYVKQGYIPAPVNKKYDKYAVGSLFIIALLKHVYQMDEIFALIQQATDGRSPEDFFDYFCETMEQAVKHAVNGTTMVKDVPVKDARGICWNVCNSIACHMYVKNVFLINRDRESFGEQRKP